MIAAIGLLVLVAAALAVGFLALRRSDANYRDHTVPPGSPEWRDVQARRGAGRAAL